MGPIGCKEQGYLIMRRYPRKPEAIRPYALDVLARSKSKKPAIDVDKIANFLGLVVNYQPFEGQLSGMIAKRGNTAVIGVNSLQGRNRQRFTVAHEIGHFLLHDFDVHVDKSFAVYKTSRNRDENSSLAIDPEEIEANRFAAELLMPQNMIEEDIEKRFDIDIEDAASIAGLAERYEVSEQAMTFRIMNLMRIG
jgi:Zn-dependent peptidase ImmA (M78 family)